MKKIAILFVAILICSISWAVYEIDPLCCNVGWNTTDWTSPGLCCELPPAPDTGDPLIGARLEITVKMDQDAGIENTGASAANVYLRTDLDYFVTAPGVTNQQIHLEEFYPGPNALNLEPLTTFDGTLDYAGTSGEMWLNRLGENTWSRTYSGAAELAWFASPFNVCFVTISSFTIGGDGATNVTASILTQGYAEACIIYEYDGEVPVTLSSFTANYFDGSPVLQWTTQSETNNIGWNVYRADSEEYEWSMQINYDLIPGAGTSSQPTDYIFEDGYTVYPNMNYWYWIEDISSDGNTNVHGPISLTVPEEGYDPESPEIYNEAKLYNVPNPFNPVTTIMFDIDGNVNGEVLIYDIKGNLVRKLHDGPVPQSGVTWDSTDSLGKKVSSGIYLYVLKTDQKTYAKKMVLTK